MENAVDIKIQSLKKVKVQEKNKFKIIRKDFKKNRALYIMMIPVLAFYIIFCYKPMYGAIIAFEDYSPMSGIFNSHWVGLKNFEDFFQSFYFWRILKNTLWISINSIFWGFPAPIIFALLLNEVRQKKFLRFVQTITYLPYFVSVVVICGMIVSFTADTGIITYLMSFFGFPKAPMLQNANLFVPIYVVSGIWQGVGWGSILYLAALSGIDQELYEAAKIDGAGRLKQTIYVTIPGIMPTIVIMLILTLGGILNVGFEKIILLYSPATYETADVISSFTYRKGLQEFNWGFSTAVGLFNSAVNFLIISLSNWCSKKMNQSSLW